MTPGSDHSDQRIESAVEYILEAEKSHGVSSYGIGAEMSAVLALRATSLADFVCGFNLELAGRKRQSAAALSAEAERRRPSGRRVHTVAESQEFLESAAHHLEDAIAAESAALSAIGASDLTAAHSAVAYMEEVEAASDSIQLEWEAALDTVIRVRKVRTKRQQWNYVRGRAIQAHQPREVRLPLTNFDRHEFGGGSLTRATETGPAGTVSSAVELLARWDLSSNPRAKAEPPAAALEAIRAVRLGEHTEVGAGIAAAIMRSRADDVFDEVEWEDEDDETLTHIAEMRARVSGWFEKFGRPIQPGPWIVSSDRFRLGGHIDFVTADTIWDLKVSATPPSRADILQVLLYWLVFQGDPSTSLNITHIGFFNPRLDVAWRIAIADIPADVMTTVEAIAASDGP